MYTCTVTFDPRRLTYTVTMPRGDLLRAATRAEAEIAWLRAVHPELADKIQRISVNVPEMAFRARQAGFLVLNGAVQLPESGEVMPANGSRYHRTATVLARVRSECGQFDYLLTRGDFGEVFCNCQDANPEPGEEGAPYGRIALHTCRHILAAVLFVEDRAESSDQQPNSSSRYNAGTLEQQKG